MKFVKMKDFDYALCWETLMYIDARGDFYYAIEDLKEILDDAESCDAVDGEIILINNVMTSPAIRIAVNNENVTVDDSEAF